MPTIEKRTSQDGIIVYRVKIRRKGYPTQTATFSRLTDARKWAQATEVAIQEGRYFRTTASKRHTVADLIDRYVRNILPHKRPSTVSAQARQLRWWRRQIGDRILADITPSLLSEYRDQLVLKLSNSTTNRYMAALSHAFTVATKEWEWLNDNPCHKLSKMREPRGRMRYLSDDERKRLLAECKISNSVYLYLVVVLALSTGARKGELLGLTWRNVDLERGIITLDDTKNAERRSLPLTGHALELMQQHAQERQAGSTLVFPSLNGARSTSLDAGWRYAIRRAGLDDFRFHDLRHTAASYLAMSGASISEIAEILGHKTLQMTKRYTHLSQDHTRNVLSRMNETMFGH